MAKMTDEEKALVVGTIDQEGFDYTFRNYTDFRDIKDPQFHRLRKQYLAASNRLLKYIGMRP